MQLNKVVNCIIGVQARSGSTRLPGKVNELIGEFSVLDRVLHSCKKTAMYMNKYAEKSGIKIKIFVLIPFSDPLTHKYEGLCVEGPEQDVLTRYYGLVDDYASDYIVRITSDCPLIPPYLITKAITTAVKNKYDYLSNVDPRFRTSPDGWDVEVISKELMIWLNSYALTKEEREHVTLKARKMPPNWAKIGAIINYIDLSHIKISVDTKHDLDFVRSQFDKINQKEKLAEEELGKTNVHRF